MPAAKKSKLLLATGIITAIVIVVKFLIPQPDIKQQIEDLRKKTAPALDSLNKRMAAENRFFDSIQYLITSGRLDGANNVINQLLERQPKNDHYLTLKGQVFDARNQYDSALYYYNYAIIINPNSGAEIEKAKTLIKIKQYPEAILLYKRAFDRNYDFSYPLARAFDLNKQKDSALKYYNIYLEHYPDSLFQQLTQQGIYPYPPDSVRMKIKNLKN